jgi:catechol 2,3-dioxygenase-like lactoylglutathione lyase family enzyme
MKLGDAVQISIGVPNLAASLAFYQKLGFETLAQDVNPYPWAQLSDGVQLYLLNQDGNHYAGLLYFAADLPERIAALEADGLPFALKAAQDEHLLQAILVDPNGFAIGMVHADPAMLPALPGEPAGRIGKFGEFSIPTADLPATLEFWRRAGFDCPAGVQSEPYPWAILVDGLVPVGIHQTNEFHQFTLTYFAPDMSARIRALKDAGLEFAWVEESAGGETLGAELHSPEGTALFLFTGEV